MLSAKRFTQRHVKDITVPPRELWGRGGSITIYQGETKLKIIAAYSPPRPWDRGKLAAWRGTVSKLNMWVRKEIQATPARFTPMVLADLNDRFQREDDGDETVGRFPTGKEGEAAAGYHKMLRDLFYVSCQHTF